MERRWLLPFLGLLLVLSCAGQTPPTREPLPDVAAAVEEALPCGFLIGDGLGVTIEDVLARGAAEGVLETGDLLVGLDGAMVTNADQLRSELSEKSVGQLVNLDIVRSGESMALVVELGANPDAPERPLLGVMIETSYDRVAAADLVGQIEGGPLVRGVSVGGRLYTLNPQAASWGSLEIEAPAGPWAAVAGGVYTMENPDTDEGALRDAISQDRIVFEIADWRGSRLLGSLGERVIVSASRLVSGQEGLFEISLMLIDPQARNARWIWIADDPELGIPLITFPSPDGTRLLVAGQGQTDEVIRYLVLSSEGAVQVRPASLTTAEDLIAVGWFDDQSALMRASDGSLSLLDPTTGVVTAAPTPVAVGTVSRAWGVGDGINVLADTGTRLIRFALEGEGEIRALADRCEVDLIGDIGWTG